MTTGRTNLVGGKPAGLSEVNDTLHPRNYGAYMSALRDDLLAIGGADEHVDYLGYVCGPYDMTWRLVNMGRTEDKTYMWSSFGRLRRRRKVDLNISDS